MSPPTTTDAVDVLRRVFGYDTFRGNQQEIIEHVAGGGDALVLMPTGGGKSLCYPIPALLRDGVGVTADRVPMVLRTGVQPADRAQRVA